MYMPDLEHEEWLRDREVQREPLKKHIIVGGLQSDAPDIENKPPHPDAVDGVEEEDDDDESENDAAASDQAADA